jgi:NADH:ubiquinone oxidoreductase subunit K
VQWSRWWTAALYWVLAATSVVLLAYDVEVLGVVLLVIALAVAAAEVAVHLRSRDP